MDTRFRRILMDLSLYSQQQQQGSASDDYNYQQQAYYAHQYAPQSAEEFLAVTQQGRGRLDNKEEEEYIQRMDSMEVNMPDIDTGTSLLCSFVFLVDNDDNEYTNLYLCFLLFLYIYIYSSPFPSPSPCLPYLTLFES